MKLLHSGDQPRTAETLTPAAAHARYGWASRPGEAAAAA
jgi:hypothetical protein